LESILGNKALIVPAAAWCMAQVLKVIVASVRDKRLNLSYLTTMGGMPSSHATLVCALATTIAVVYGVGSALSLISQSALGAGHDLGNGLCLIRAYLGRLLIIDFMIFFIP